MNESIRVWFILAKSEKLRFKAVVGLNSVFDIDIPVQNSQRKNALIAIRWQVRYTKTSVNRFFIH